MVAGERRYEEEDEDDDDNRILRVSGRGFLLPSYSRSALPPPDPSPPQRCYDSCSIMTTKVTEIGSQEEPRSWFEI
jgi:hypothetical protein